MRNRSIGARRLWLGTVTSLLLTGGVGVVSAQDRERGRELFVANGCYQCHGYVGQGGPGTRIAPSRYPFEAFAAFVRRPVNEMPAYSPSTLGDSDLQAIFAYLRSVPEPASAADIPALR